ncbi:MAG: hypothetical protein ABR962_03595 [Candidatus Bathyarchaeia archaeon]|jgi:hypothetical protein
MPHVIWDEDLGAIQHLIDDIRACVNPLPDALDKKLVRIEKLLKSVRGELEPDEEFAVLEPDEKLRQLTENFLHGSLTQELDKKKIVNRGFALPWRAR